VSDKSHEGWRQDVSAYLLGALEPERAGALERHLEGCERCRQELRWLTPAVDALPESVERIEPPPGLRARLLAEVEEDAAAVRPRERGGFIARLRDTGLPGLRPAIGFAALALVAAALVGYAIGGGAGDGDEATISAGKAPGVTARMTDEGDGGTLRLANVHDLPRDRVLEAWVQRGGEVEPVRALFVPDHEGRASTQLPSMDGVEVVMVTAEPRGGSETPTGEPLITIRVPS
jgi:anti-sigma-K factor RskA